MKPRDWLRLAERDWDTCELLEQRTFDDNAKTNACFHIQQAVEKALKGLLEDRVDVHGIDNIGVLIQLCDENGIKGLPGVSQEIADTLNEWSYYGKYHHFDEQIYETAAEIYEAASELLKQQVAEAGTSIDALQDKFNNEYFKMMCKWQQMSPEEIIESAEKIVAAKFVKENLSKAVSEEEAEYLLEFKSPFEVITDRVMDERSPNDIAAAEWFSDLLTEIYDKKDEYDIYDLYDGDSEDEGIAFQ